MFKKNAKLSTIQRKYCSCVVKVRGRILNNPYGICTKSIYHSRKKRRTKKVGCLKNLDIKKLSKNEIKGILLEKDNPSKRFITNYKDIKKYFKYFNKILFKDKLNNFNDKIQKFNLHYELQINNLKNRIVNIILEILKQYSEDNKIDLVLDSNNYVLSSNSINITDIIKDKVNNKSIEINFEKY